MILKFMHTHKCVESWTLSSADDVWKTIRSYLDEQKYHQYYIRGWIDGFGHIWIDFGSHLSFFVVEDCSIQEVSDILSFK